MWQLGRHRLLCGSALEEATWQRLLEGKRAEQVFTDPPYNVRIDGHVGGRGRTKYREFAMASGEMVPEQFGQFLCTTLKLSLQHTRPGALVYCFMDWRH